MSLETSNKILKIFGILDIVFGAIGIVVAILALIGGAAVATMGDQIGVSDADAATVGGVVIIAGIIALISGIVSLIEGVLSLKAVKDNTKIMPAWVFAIVALAISVISVIINLAQGNGLSGLLSIAINVLVFVAANTIKKSVGK